MQIDSSYKFDNPKGFIVLEGLNGAGKTTLLKKIEQHLEQHDLKFKSTFEPGGSPIGKTIRSILLGQNEYQLNSVAELLLFCAERAEHVAKVVQPALEQKLVVISDRYYYSSIAFQGYARGLNLDLVNTACSMAIQNTLPDLVILLDLDVKTAMTRLDNRVSDDTDSFESEKYDFHQKLRKGFLELSDTCKEVFFVVDANQDQDSMWEQLQPVLNSWSESYRKVNHQ